MGNSEITYDQAKSALWRIYRDTLVKPTAEAVMEAVEEGQDEGDAFHEAVDSALTYYKDQYLTLMCSDADDQYFDQMGGNSVEGDCDTKIIGQLAYFNLMADVQEEYQHRKEEKEAANEI